MRDKLLLDTNVFVYSFDATAQYKQRQARELIKSTMKNGSGHISFQVVQEFFNIATRKFEVPMSLFNCKEYLDKILMQFEIVYPDTDYMKAGLDIAATTGFLFIIR